MITSLMARIKKSHAYRNESLPLSRVWYKIRLGLSDIDGHRHSVEPDFGDWSIGRGYVTSYGFFL